MYPTISSPLGKTALYICACRAYETKNRPLFEVLFNDPFAEKLAGEYGFAFLKVMAESIEYDMPLEAKINIFANSISIRTAYFDKVLQHALEADKSEQIVIFAVGGDCRPFRMSFPQNCKIFEFDLPEVILYRSTILKELGAKCPCQLISLGCDLTKPEIWIKKLKENGFDASKKTFFLLEGLLMYLKNEERETLLKNISDLCAEGSIIAGDFLSDEYLTSETNKKFLDLWNIWGSPIVSTCSNPEKLIDKLGFVCKVNTFGDVDTNFGRFPNYPKHRLEEGSVRILYFSGIKK